MKLYVAITDMNWFQRLKARGETEVNFWRPGGRRSTSLSPGDLCLFKAKADKAREDFGGKIIGGGFFVRHQNLPLKTAWDSFGERNGCPSFDDFEARIATYRAKNRIGDDQALIIGCTILNNAFYFDEVDWLDPPADWKKPIVSGKTYTLDNSNGVKLYNDVMMRLRAYGRNDPTSTDSMNIVVSSDNAATAVSVAPAEKHIEIAPIASPDTAVDIAINEFSDSEHKGSELSNVGSSSDAGKSSGLSNFPFDAGEIVQAVFPILQNDPRMTREEVEELTKESSSARFKTYGHAVLKPKTRNKYDRDNCYYPDLTLSFFGEDYWLSQFRPPKKILVLEWLNSIGMGRDEVLTICRDRFGLSRKENEEQDRIIKDYGDASGEIKSEDELKGEGVTLCTIDEVKRGSSCNGIGIKMDSSHFRIFRLKKSCFAEALRFVAMWMYIRHKEAMRAEASKGQNERLGKHLKDLAMCFDGLMGMKRTEAVTNVFWLGKYGEDPVVNGKLDAPSIARFIGALVEIDNAYKREQIVFF